MQPRRHYPSWLPPNPRERTALVQLNRWQNLVIIWLAGLLPAGWISAIATDSSDLFVPITIFWIVVGIILARHVTSIPCPRCTDKFCARQEPPYWNALLNRRCDSCGLALNPERDP